MPSKVQPNKRKTHTKGMSPQAHTSIWRKKREKKERDRAGSASILSNTKKTHPPIGTDVAG